MFEQEQSVANASFFDHRDQCLLKVEGKRVVDPSKIKDIDDTKLHAFIVLSVAALGEMQRNNESHFRSAACTLRVGSAPCQVTSAVGP